MTIESAIVSVNGKVMGDLDELIKRPTEEFTEAIEGLVKRAMRPAREEVAELTTTERAELGRYEAVIKRGLDTFVQVGNALLAIRRDRLYRGEYGTWEAYCEQKWKITFNFANKLIGAAQVVENLEQIGTVVPISERQARPLTSLPEESQAAAWSNAVEDAGGNQPTPAQVEKAASEFTTKRELKAAQVKRLHPTTATPTPELAKPVYIEPTPAKPPEPLSPRQIINTLRTYAVDDSEFADALKLATVEELSRALDGMDAIGDYTRREAIAGQIRTLEPAAPVAAEPTPIYPREPERIEINDEELRTAGFHLVRSKYGPDGWLYSFWWTRSDFVGAKYGPQRGTAELAIEDARQALAELYASSSKTVEAEPTPIEQAIAEATPDKYAVPDKYIDGNINSAWVVTILANFRPSNIEFETALTEATPADLDEAVRVMRLDMFWQDRIREIATRQRRLKAALASPAITEAKPSHIDIINRDLDAYEAGAKAEVAAAMTPDDLAAEGYAIVPSQDGKGWRWKRSLSSVGESAIYGPPYLDLSDAIESARKLLDIIERYPESAIKAGLKTLAASKPEPVTEPRIPHPLLEWAKELNDELIAEPVPVDDIRSLINIVERTSGHKPDVIGLVERVERWLGTVIA